MVTSHIVPYKVFLDEIKVEISLLSRGSLQFAGAMFAAQKQYEPQFIIWIIDEIEKIVKISEESPIVIAAIKIYICAESRPYDEAISLCLPEFSLIEATDKLSDLKTAVSFVTKVTKKYVSLMFLNA